MPINIEMPKLSDTMTEGTVVRWLKKEGDEVEIGDIIAEIETDKATMEMEAFDEGTLSKISVPEGGKAQVGSAIAVLLEDGEGADEPAPAAESAPATTSTAPPAVAKALESAAATVNKSEPAPPAPAATKADGGRIKASPHSYNSVVSLSVDPSGMLKVSVSHSAACPVANASYSSLFARAWAKSASCAALSDWPLSSSPTSDGTSSGPSAASEEARKCLSSLCGW